MMHEPEKSDSVGVAVKPTNKAERSAAEPVEPRAGTKGNAGQQSTCRAQNRVGVSQEQDRMRQALAAWTRGRSRMRESCTYGSARGAGSNPRPYRNRREFIAGLGSAAVWPVMAAIIFSGAGGAFAQQPPSFTKTFGSAFPIPVHGSTSLTFTVDAFLNAFTITGLAFTDALPAGLVIST